MFLPLTLGVLHAIEPDHGALYALSECGNVVVGLYLLWKA